MHVTTSALWAWHPRIRTILWVVTRGDEKYCPYEL